MSPIRTFQNALASMSSNKLRAFLTLLGIVIGVAAVISLMAIGRGAQQAVVANIQALGTNLLFVRPGSTTQSGITGAQGSATTLTLNDANSLVDPIYAPDVAKVAPELRTNARILAGRNNTVTQVIGVTPDYLDVRNISLQYGAFIGQANVENHSDVVVLGSRVATTLFGSRNPAGQFVRIGGAQFTVIGVLKGQGGNAQALFDDQVLVPITTAYYRLSNQRTTQGSVSVQTINVQVNGEQAMDAAVQEIGTLLRLRHRLTGQDDFTITSQQETVQALQNTTSTFVVFLAAIAGISLIVGGIGIMNIMLVSVSERTREIGIRKAVGARRRDLFLQFLTEATLLSLGGGGLGLLMGVGIAKLLNGKNLAGTTFQTVLSSDVAIMALLVSVGIGLFFGMYPAMRAARLHPIEALRHL